MSERDGSAGPSSPWLCRLALVASSALMALAIVPPVMAGADPPANPQVAGVYPDDGPSSGGTSVTISGTGFSKATAVAFGSAQAESFTIDSDTSITAVSPPKAEYWGIVDVTVSGTEGSSKIVPQDRFGYGPIVAGMTPQQGPASGGTAVTLSGFGLEGASAVYFGSSPAANFTENPEGTITAISPRFSMGETIAVVTVIMPEGRSATYTNPDIEPANYFTYGPTVSGIEPDEGPAAGGTVVTIHGSGFTSSPIGFRCLCGAFVHRIAFGQQQLKCGSPLGSAQLRCAPVEYTVVSDSEITVTAPPGSGTVDLQVATDGGDSPVSAVDEYTYASPPGPGGQSENLVRLTCTTPRPGTTRRHTHVDKARRKVGRPRRHVQREICSSRPVQSAGDVTDGGPLAAQLLHEGVIYAKGKARRVSSSRTEMVLEAVRPVAAGRYRLLLRRANRQGLRTQRRQWSEQVVIR